MGYSVYIKTKDPELQKKMFEFLEKNMKDYTKEILSSNLYATNLAEGEHLEYGARCKNTIGFNYKSWVFGMERFYVTEIVKWMSKKIGDEKHYEYDGETTEITDSFESKDYMKMLRHECELYSDKNLFKKSIEFIKSEIARLDKLWDEV